MSLDPKVYRRAAERLGRDGCCIAIRKAVGKRITVDPHQVAFAHFFKPSDRVLYWWDWTPESKTARILALLFMEQIAKDSQ